MIEAAVSSTDFLVTSIVGHWFFLKIFFEFSTSSLIFSKFVYAVLSFSFKLFSLFFLISNNLSASVVKPTIQGLKFFLVILVGIDFSLTNGIFEVL